MSTTITQYHQIGYRKRRIYRKPQNLTAFLNLEFSLTTENGQLSPDDFQKE